MFITVSHLVWSKASGIPSSLDGALIETPLRFLLLPKLWRFCGYYSAGPVPLRTPESQKWAAVKVGQPKFQNVGLGGS